MTTSPSLHRVSVLLAAILTACGCNTAPHPELDQRSVAQIAGELVDVAETRADLRRVRAYLHQVNELTTAGGQKNSTAAIAKELEHQLLLALHSRINVIDTQLPAPDAETEDDPVSSARLHRATHVLIGDYARDGDDLMLCLRLVDLESRVIVAASEGNIPLLALSDDARAASRTPVWRRPSYVWRGK